MEKQVVKSNSASNNDRIAFQICKPPNKSTPGIAFPMVFSFKKNSFEF
jgi:hypothetical protein